MTGFGAGSATAGHARITAEVRSVNARTLDVRSRVPDALGTSALWAEQEVRKRLRRGRVEVSLVCEGEPEAALLDRGRAVAAMRALEGVAAELGVSERPPLSLLAAVPGLFVGGTIAGAKDAASRALDGALSELDADRAREGAAIAEELARRADAVLALARQAGERAASLPAAARARLSDRLAKLPGVLVDPARLEAEIALLADRCEVSEELSRLTTHVAHFKALVTGSARSVAEGGAPSAEPEGRRLDFLLQEAMREATTLGVKAQDARVSADVVEVKVELERMREQVQNVE
ncbi:MAG: DUF1732 domain-containing protein [Polyangiaceae bacterium]|jgi:uncharacterized protein YicC (UPF0701 family)|nr:DUF1732 domain-containing protein [Polyangiaceae bacterium]